MRITVRTLALLGSGLLSLSAAADPAPPPAEVRRVVGTTLSATQAALLDEDTGEYRLVRLGDEVNGARVVAIGDGDVVLLRGGTREQISLAADSRPRPRMTLEPMVIRMRPAAPVAVAAAAPATATASAPVTASVPAQVAVVAPAPVAAVPPAPVSAPVAAVAPAPVAVAAPTPVVVAAPAAVAAPVAPPAPVAVAAPASVAATPPAPPPAPANNGMPKIVFVEPLIPPPSVPAPVSTPPAPPAPAQESLTTVPRAELDRGLGNFAALDASVQLELEPQGGFRVANLQTGSFLEKLGLRRGDVIERVDGRPLRGVDDASAAYNWVRVTDHFAVELLRDGRPITLRFQITA